MFDKQIGASEADENLVNLASLAKLLVEHEQIKLEEAALTLDGRRFYHEADRIEAAFSDLKP